MTALQITLGLLGAAFAYTTIGHIFYAVAVRWPSSDPLWRVEPGERQWAVGAWPFIVAMLSARRFCLICEAIGKALYCLPLAIYRCHRFPYWVARGLYWMVEPYRRRRRIRLAKARVVDR